MEGRMVVDDGVWIVCNEIYFQLLQFVKWHYLFAYHSFVLVSLSSPHWLIGWDQFLQFLRKLSC